MVKIPHADEGAICPLHKVDTSTVCHKCPWWTRVIGKNPQSEEMIDDWRCAIALSWIRTSDGGRAGRKSASRTARAVSWPCPACKAVKNKEPRRTRQHSAPARS